MTFTLELRSMEPCDVYIVARDEMLLALVAESQCVYAKVLGSPEGLNFTVVCRKHEFTHKTLEVKVVDDLVLVDGAACYSVLLNDYNEEVIVSELSSC